MLYRLSYASTPQTYNYTIGSKIARDTEKIYWPPKFPPPIPPPPPDIPRLAHALPHWPKPTRNWILDNCYGMIISRNAACFLTEGVGVSRASTLLD